MCPESSFGPGPFKIQIVRLKSIFFVLIPTMRRRNIKCYCIPRNKKYLLSTVVLNCNDQLIEYQTLPYVLTLSVKQTSFPISELLSKHIIQRVLKIKKMPQLFDLMSLLKLEFYHEVRNLKR